MLKRKLPTWVLCKNEFLTLKENRNSSNKQDLDINAR